MSAINGRRMDKRIQEKLMSRLRHTEELWERLEPTVVAREVDEKRRKQSALLARKQQHRILSDLLGDGVPPLSGNDSVLTLLPVGMPYETAVDVAWRAVEADDVQLLEAAVCRAQQRRASADVLDLRRRGDTVLHAACFHGSAKVVDHLLAVAAAREATRARRGSMASVESATSSSQQRRETVISAYADPSQLNMTPLSIRDLVNMLDSPHSRTTPLMEAMRGPVTSLASRVGILSALVDAGADVCARNVRGDNALHIAAQNSAHQLVRHLALRASAGVIALDARNDRGETPLDVALALERKTRHVAVLRELKRSGGTGALDADGAEVAAALRGTLAPSPRSKRPDTDSMSHEEVVASLPDAPRSRRHGEALRCAHALLTIRAGGMLRRLLHVHATHVSLARARDEATLQTLSLEAARLLDRAHMAAEQDRREAERRRSTAEGAAAAAAVAAEAASFPEWLESAEGKAALRDATEVEELDMLAAEAEKGRVGALITREQHRVAAAQATAAIAMSRREAAEDAARARFRDTVCDVLIHGDETAV